MAVASPRLFLALCLSFPLRLCVSSCLSSRVFTHRSTLRPSSCTEFVPHTTYAHVYTPTYTYICTHLHMHPHTYTYMYTYTCELHLVFSLALCTILRSFDPSSSSSSSSSSSCSFFPLVRSSHELRATTYV